MSLHLYNTLTRRVEAFTPLDPACPTMYVCGPTVYNYVHIGNARGPVVFGVLADLLRRRHGGLRYARNITDVDDKINAAAREQGVPIATITDRFAAAYREDMAALGVAPPDIEPEATAHIAQIIAMIERLIDQRPCLRRRGPRAVLGCQQSGLRQAVAPRPGRDAGRRAGRGRAVQARCRRLRAVEALQRRLARLGLAVGPRAPGLAYRMLGDGRGAPGTRPSTSMPAASTCSSRTTRTKSRKANVRMAARRSHAGGCTTACSTSAVPR